MPPSKRKATPEPEPVIEPADAPEDEYAYDPHSPLPLTPEGRISVTVGTTFSYRGNSHWPKVTVEDSIGVMEDSEGNILTETSKEAFYRVEETAHRRLHAIVARMKHDIDARAASDLAARTRTQ